MKTKNENFQKKIYNQPQIERIIIDNEISLVLHSDPSDPGGSGNNILPQENNKVDPY